MLFTGAVPLSGEARRVIFALLALEGITTAELERACLPGGGIAVVPFPRLAELHALAQQAALQGRSDETASKVLGRCALLLGVATAGGLDLKAIEAAVRQKVQEVHGLANKVLEQRTTIEQLRADLEAANARLVELARPLARLGPEDRPIPYTLTPEGRRALATAPQGREGHTGAVGDELMCDERKG